MTFDCTSAGVITQIFSASAACRKQFCFGTLLSWHTDKDQLNGFRRGSEMALIWDQIGCDPISRQKVFFAGKEGRYCVIQREDGKVLCYRDEQSAQEDGFFHSPLCSSFLGWGVNFNRLKFGSSHKLNAVWFWKCYSSASLLEKRQWLQEGF